MNISNIVLDFIGHANVNPRLVTLMSNDPMATVLASNYLKPLKDQGYAFLNSDFILANCSDGKFLGSISISGDTINITQIAPAPGP
jgi:hypothetical protein